MPRESIGAPEKDKTTIVTSSTLLNRVSLHVKKQKDDNMTDFVTRALINQLEKEGDFEIRFLIEEEQNGSEN